MVGNRKYPLRTPKANKAGLIGADHRGKRGILPILFTESSSKLGEILRPSAPKKISIKQPLRWGFIAQARVKPCHINMGQAKKTALTKKPSFEKPTRWSLVQFQILQDIRGKNAAKSNRCGSGCGHLFIPPGRLQQVRKDINGRSSSGETILHHRYQFGACCPQRRKRNDFAGQTEPR